MMSMDVGGALNSNELEIMGYEPVYDYTQYSHDNHVNVIPEKSFKRLVQDTFKTIANVLRETYGPYGSTVVISDQNQTTTTKDGYNVFTAMGFSHHYKKMVYLAIQKICERVNKNVGDGTTSCILLAEKIFNRINELNVSPDEKRQIMKILTSIEQNLQDSSILMNDMEYDHGISPLTKESFGNVISLAGNYDDELTNILYEAFDPTFDEDNEVTSIRNVIVDKEVDNGIDSNTLYDIDFLPGDYRVRINMDVEMGLSLNEPSDMKIVIYDHAFNGTDWVNFMNGYNHDEKVLIMARAFPETILKNEYARYLKDRYILKEEVKLILCEIKGSYVQKEISDLAAVLGVKPNTLNSPALDHSMIPTVTIQVHKGNCLCFHNVKPPKEYIETLRLEMNKDMTKSYIKRNEYVERIRALTMDTKDTLITVKSASSLELEMIADKIDDCVSIVRSAFDNGVVPNMLRYGHSRMVLMNDIKEFEGIEELSSTIVDAILKSIEGLFVDVWNSKYPDEELSNDIAESFYMGLYKSYDIISDKCVDMTQLPTSSQYDIEVIVAAISIVKYLLTSRALIFDAHLMRPTGDQGHYQRI